MILAAGALHHRDGKDRYLADMPRVLASASAVGIYGVLASPALLGLATGGLYLLTGRIGGMSTVFSAVWSYVSQRPFFQQPRFTGSR